MMPASDPKQSAWMTIMKETDKPNKYAKGKGKRRETTGITVEFGGSRDATGGNGMQQGGGQREAVGGSERQREST